MWIYVAKMAFLGIVIFQKKIPEIEKCGAAPLSFAYAIYNIDVAAWNTDHTIHICTCVCGTIGYIVVGCIEKKVFLFGIPRNCTALAKIEQRVLIFRRVKNKNIKKTRRVNKFGPNWRKTSTRTTKVRSACCASSFEHCGKFAEFQDFLQYERQVCATCRIYQAREGPKVAYAHLL